MSNQPPDFAKIAKALSPAMRRPLVNLYQGRDAWSHISGRSMFGGSGQTERALRNRGLIQARGQYGLALRNFELTDIGRAVAACLTEPRP